MEWWDGRCVVIGKWFLRVVLGLLLVRGLGLRKVKVNLYGFVGNDFLVSKVGVSLIFWKVFC